MARKLPLVHPGEVLREEFLRPLGWSVNRLASELRVPAQRINRDRSGAARHLG
jgi:addiction module HigA family antidote